MKKNDFLIHIDVVEQIKKYYINEKNDENARYLSWEHCYYEFNQHHKKKMTDEVLDYLSLHLAFYLASWGCIEVPHFYFRKTIKFTKI